MNYETPQFFRVMQYADAADGDVVDMVSGEPDWAPPEALREGLRAYADADPAEFQYPASEGLLGLREEIAERRGVGVEQVVLTSGAGEANHLATAAGLECYPGSEILLADPVYPYYAGRANFHDAEFSLVPVADDGHLDPTDVRAAADDETAVVVINTPNNPMGVTYDAGTMAGLAEVAAEHEALLVSDEVYDHYDYGGRFASALGVDSPNRVVVNSFSKSMAITGWRVGYAVFPPEGSPTPAGDLGQRARTHHMLAVVTGSRPAQAAVLHALRNTGPEYYEGVRDRMRTRIATFTDALDELGAGYTDPEGAFYVMVDLPGVDGSLESIHRLIDEAGVAGMPGEAFGHERAGWVRFSLTTDRVEEAAQRLVEYVG